MEIFDYDNILLLPRKCQVQSRSKCDASVELVFNCNNIRI
jgi:GMP reductase